MFENIVKRGEIMETLVYTVSEAAELLGISKSYAYDLVKQKKLPVLEIGKRRVIPKRMLEEWILANTEFHMDEKSL